MELWLPKSYEGGDPSSQDVDMLIEKLKVAGPEFDRAVQMLERNPSAFALLAIDTNIGDSGFLTVVLIVTERVPSALTVDLYLEMATKQLPSQFRVLERGTLPLDCYQAGQLVVEFTVQGVTGKEVIYVIKEGNAIWCVTYATSSDEFEQRLPTFEQSIRTLRIRP